MKFTEENINKIFGCEAAEDENVLRLKEYYFKSDIYNKIHNDMPLRIMVGHKGIGKSATFKVSYLENMSEKNIAVWIKPDDIMDIAKTDGNFLEQINAWKKGLLQIITYKILENLEIEVEKNTISKIVGYTGKFISKLADMFNGKFEDVSFQSAQNVIIRKFLKDKKIFVYIDDLDRGWNGSEDSIRRISTLINATRDLTSDNCGLCIRISLRSDVYFLVRTSDESTDKIEGNVIWYIWTQHQLLVMLAKRIITFKKEKINERQLMKKPQFEIAKYYDGILEDNFHGIGKWSNVPTYKVLASMIRRRPRDLVKICSMAARTAYEHGHDVITTEDLLDNFDMYSQERIQDTVNEYKSELPDIQRLIMGMKPSNRERRTKDEFIYTTEELIKKIGIITDGTPFCFTNGKIAKEDELAAFLYKINFIVARKKMEDDGNRIDRKYFEDNKYLSNSFVDFGYQWEVHPAFRWALYPDGGSYIYDNLSIDGEI
ncbi:MAG: hypothetical protein J6L61_09630 [Ruminiclostridium sp.]|nr:hypothetical protein [Ruminiclostridium sp.]